MSSFIPAFVEISASGARSNVVVIDGVEYKMVRGHAEKILVKLTTVFPKHSVDTKWRPKLPLALRLVARAEIVNARDGAEVTFTGALVGLAITQAKQGDYTSAKRLVDCTTSGL